MLHFSDFVEFLYKEKCLRLYFDNMQKEFERKNAPLIRLRLKALLADNPAVFVSAAFLWDNSKEGYDFWYNIHLKWMKLIYNER